MCTNNLRVEHFFPARQDDGLLFPANLLPAVQDEGLLLPAVRDQVPTDQFLPADHASNQSALPDPYAFELVV